MTTESTWAALLAGGDGLRLQSLTRSITGDHRPKQYCRLLGSRSLLADTRARVRHVVPPDRTLYLVSQSHEPFYRDELGDVQPWQVCAQPRNRGTMTAVAYSLLRLRSMGIWTGVLGLFPCDHYCRDSATFTNAVASVYGEARRSPETVFLLGARATRPETQYGWIVPGESLSSRPNPAGGEAWQFRSVRSFVEKPSEALARDLFEQARLWNTFVTIGTIGALESLIATARPDLWEQMGRLGAVGMSQRDDRLVSEPVYAAVDHADLSRDALAAFPERLRVLVLPEVGWTALGHPDRVADVLADRRQVIQNSQVAG